MEQSFIRYMYRKRCQFEQKPEKIKEIEKGVKGLVHKLLDRLGGSFELFKISKIIEGGSFYEQTKIGAPDEFDYMIVLTKFSTPGAITLEGGCYQWYKKVCVSKENKTYTGFLESDIRLIHERLENTFWSSLQTLCRDKTSSETTESGTISTVGCKNHKLQLRFLEDRMLEISTGINFKEETKPKSTGLVLIPSVDIGVDLMLAIEHPNIEEIITNEGFPVELKHLVKENGCHLVAKNCNSTNPPCDTCWHVSLAASELQLMRDMNETHKQSYKVLKYLLTREVPYSGKCANLSSYMLKNAFMFHCYGENACTSAHISKCVHAVLDYLISRFRRGKMPCFLPRNIDTWGPVLKFPVLESETFPSKFMDDTELALEWYAVCWLELWRRVVIKFQKLLREVDTIQGYNVTDKMHLMKESMMVLIESYCKHRNIQHEVHYRTLHIPTEISDSELDEKFVWYFGRLKQLFDIKLGNLLE